MATFNTLEEYLTAIKAAIKAREYAYDDIVAGLTQKQREDRYDPYDEEVDIFGLETKKMNALMIRVRKLKGELCALFLALMREANIPCGSDSFNYLTPGGFRIKGKSLEGRGKRMEEKELLFSGSCLTFLRHERIPECLQDEVRTEIMNTYPTEIAEFMLANTGW